MSHLPRAVFLSGLLSLLGTVLLQPLAAAQASLPTVTAMGVNVKAPPLGMTAARGDGQADDTTALQSEIQYCQDHNVPLLLAPGVYKITSPLHIAIPPDDQTKTFIPIQSGIVIRGLTNAARQADTRTGFGSGGVTLLMAGSQQDAVIEVDGAASTYMLISDITLDGGPAALRTKYAIHAAYSHWSGLRMDNVQTADTDTAVAVTGNPVGHGGATGGNGEELDCYSCHFVARRCCYLNTSDSGQAYLHHFFACSIYISQPGGVAFEIGSGGGGCQCDFYGTSLSMADGGSAPNVFFQDDGTSDPINWWGGRAEHIDTLIKWNGGGPGLTGHVNIEGMAFPTVHAKGALLSGGGTNCQYDFTIRSCYFDNIGLAGPLSFNYGGGGFERITFDDCDFLGWSDVRALTESPRTVLRACRYTIRADSFLHDLVHRPVPVGGRH